MAHIYNSQLDAYTLYHQTHAHSSSSSATSSIGPALPALGHALSGSTGTAISNLAIYPLDLIITRLQVQRSLRSSSASPNTPRVSEYRGVLDAFQKIYTNEGGIAAFYTGVLQDTGKSIADSFLFFLFYNYLRERRLQKNGTKSTTLPALEELIVGALAGGMSKFFTTPISNIVTRKQTSSLLASRSTSSSSKREQTVAEIAQSIRDEKGLQGFWSGYSASLVLTLNPSLTFFLYEFFKRSFLPRAKRDDPGARVTFLMAAVAKGIASTITYPFSLAKARAQTSRAPPVDEETVEEVKADISASANTSSDNKEKEKNLKDAAKKAKAAAKKNNVFASILEIYRTEGVEALYEGVYGEILKGFFSHGITMLVKETIHKGIIKLYFLILRTLGRFEQKVTEGKEAVENAIEGTKEKAGEVLSGGYHKIGEVVSAGKETAGVVGERAAVLGSNTTEVASEGLKKATEVASEGYKSASNGVRGGVGAVGEKMTAYSNGSAPKMPETKGKEVLDETVQKAGKVIGVEELKSEDAGHLLGNAQEMLGDRIKDVGEGLKGTGKGGE